MKLSNKKIKYIRRQASKKTPEEIAKDLRIKLKDVHRVLEQSGGKPQKSGILTHTTIKDSDTTYKFHLIAILAICLFGIIVYSNTLNSPFIFDDEHSIVENKTIRNLPNYLSLAKLLEPRAIVDFTFALNYRFSKLNVLGYHLLNILIHILNGLLVYFFVLTILKQLAGFSSSPYPSISASPDFSIRIISLFAALIFVVHPIQTQAVTYTVQRYASMAAMFYMASVLFYLKARIIQQNAQGREQIEQEKDGKTNRFKLLSFYVLSIFCGILAFLSKQNAASLPGAILLVEFLLIDRTWQEWKKKLPWFAISFALWAFFILYISGLFSGGFEGSELLEDASGLMKETKAVNRWQYLCTQFNVVVIYIRLLFLPVQQNLDYLYPFKNGFFDSYTPFAFLLLIGIATLGIWYIKKQPVISFAIFWFFITLSVESSIIPIRDALFEHRLYLPMLGFGLFVSYQLFYYLSNKRPLALVLSLSIITFLGSATYLRNIAWQDNTNLWSDVVSKSPHNYRAHNNLGNALKKQGRTAEAIEHFLQALRIKPDYVEAHNNLGNALKKQGRTAEAIEHFLQALRIKPDYAYAHNNLGIVLNKQGRTAEAIEHYLQALRIKPDYVEAHNNLGIALNKQGRTAEAIEHYLQALRIKPDYANAHCNLGIALSKQDRTKEAIEHFIQSVSISPDYEIAHNNLGIALSKQGRTAEAIEHYLQALRINPDYEKAHFNLGIALFRTGNIQGAIAHFREVLRINPDHVYAKINLKNALMMQQQNK